MKDGTAEQAGRTIKTPGPSKQQQASRCLAALRHHPRPRLMTPALRRSDSRSSTNRHQSKGDSTPPCGQPAATVYPMLQRFMDTWTVLLFSMEVIHLVSVGSTPRLCKARSIDKKDALSKAPSMSRKVASAISLCVKAK
ncbi:hypothetical protein Trydic_g98 [Trypoxylus dichotomus]